MAPILSGLGAAVAIIPLASAYRMWHYPGMGLLLALIIVVLLFGGGGLAVGVSLIPLLIVLLLVCIVAGAVGRGRFY